jgi:hypothetical protein
VRPSRARATSPPRLVGERLGEGDLGADRLRSERRRDARGEAHVATSARTRAALCARDRVGAVPRSGASPRRRRCRRSVAASAGARQRGGQRRERTAAWRGAVARHLVHGQPDIRAHEDGRARKRYPRRPPIRAPGALHVSRFVTAQAAAGSLPRAGSPVRHHAGESFGAGVRETRRSATIGVVSRSMP